MVAWWQFLLFFLGYLRLLLFGRTLSDCLSRNARLYGDKSAFWQNGSVVSWSALEAGVNRRANVLKAGGIARGDVLALMMDNGLAYVETLLACCRLGVVGALINPSLKGKSLEHVFTISGACCWVVGEENLEKSLPLWQSWQSRQSRQSDKGTRGREKRMSLLIERGQGCTDDNECSSWHSEAVNFTAEAAKSKALLPPPVRVRGKETALLVYTSGTTGLPKAARISYVRWMTAGLLMGKYALGLSKKDCLYCPLPLYHSNGVLIALGSSVVSGAQLALTVKFSVSRFWQEATASRATAFVYIGELIRYLLHQPASEVELAHGVSRILGNGLNKNLWSQVRQRFGISQVREFYAATEGNLAMVNLADATGSVGRPVLRLGSNDLLVRLDKDNQLVRDANGYCIACETGEVGELLGRVGKLTPFGAYTDKGASRAKLLYNVLRQGDCYFRSGDLLSKDKNGCYVFVDRIGDTFRWKGENVSTQEVESVVSQWKGVAVASVVGVVVAGCEGRAGLAAVQMYEGAEVDLSKWVQQGRAQLPDYAMPVFVRVMKLLPISQLFKLQKTHLRKEGILSSSAEIYYLAQKANTYKVLDKKALDTIKNGKIRL